MGKFYCGDHVEIEMDDRALAHLQMVIGAKLRRGESMMFTWRDPLESGDGRSTVWIHPMADLYFKYYGGKKPQINPHWIDDLMLQANTPGGLQLIEEPSGEVEAHPETESIRINSMPSTHLGPTKADRDRH